MKKKKKKYEYWALLGVLVDGIFLIVLLKILGVYGMSSVMEMIDFGEVTLLTKLFNLSIWYVLIMYVVDELLKNIKWFFNPRK